MRLSGEISKFDINIHKAYWNKLFFFENKNIVIIITNTKQSSIKDFEGREGGGV